jgi:hypothetical protein
MFYDAEWDDIVSNGEFSESVILLFDSVQYPVNVTKGQGWNRSKPDGQLTTDKPLNVRSLIISKTSIPAVVSNNNYNDIKFVIDDIVFSVIVYTGTDTLRFFLKASNDSVPTDEDEEETTESEEEVVDSESTEDGLMEI